MNADRHSMEYEFEELQPVINGVRLDLYISGTAELMEDKNYMFFVRTITLPGSVKDTFAQPGLYTGYPRKAVPLVIERPAKDDTSQQAQLFWLIEDAIDNDESAVEAWRSEFEAA